MGDRIAQADLPRLENDAKIGLLATVDGDGKPHISLITSLQARTPTELMFGQFTEGRSKEHVRREPRTAFAILTPDRTLWRGTARWTRAATEGEDHEAYNRKPMFRYNAYFGIHTVHYLDLVETRGAESLPLLRIAAGIATTTLARGVRRGAAAEDPFTPWARTFIGSPGTLKFVAFVRPDGFPWIVPMVPCAVADGPRLVLAATVHRAELAALTSGQPVAVFAANMQAESVLVRGPFRGFRRVRGPRVGVVDVAFVYNSMPPQHGPVYPRPPLETVTDFGEPLPSAGE